MFIVINRFGPPPPDPAAPQPRFSPRPHAPSDRFSALQMRFSPHAIPQRDRHGPSPPGDFAARLYKGTVRRSIVTVSDYLAPPSQQAHHESDWGIGFRWITFSRLIASLSWQHCHPSPLTLSFQRRFVLLAK